MKVSKKDNIGHAVGPKVFRAKGQCEGGISWGGEDTAGITMLQAKKKMNLRSLR